MTTPNPTQSYEEKLEELIQDAENEVKAEKRTKTLKNFGRKTLRAATIGTAVGTSLATGGLVAALGTGVLIAGIGVGSQYLANLISENYGNEVSSTVLNGISGAVNILSGNYVGTGFNIAATLLSGGAVLANKYQNHELSERLMNYSDISAGIASVYTLGRQIDFSGISSYFNSSE
ncbi:hypothetical protein HOG47_02610, partial [archaeon]|nr:hypothetical protein [archaeon]